MAEYIHPRPFSDEINAEKAVMKGTTKVGDEECYQIHVVYRNARGAEAMWYFSKKDFLPRRVDRIRPGQDGGQEHQVVILPVARPVVSRPPIVSRRRNVESCHSAGRPT